MRWMAAMVVTALSVFSISHESTAFMSVSRGISNMSGKINIYEPSFLSFCRKCSFQTMLAKKESNDSHDDSRDDSHHEKQNEKNNENERDNLEPVTKESQIESDPDKKALGKAQVKRKKKNGSRYKTLDNRDSLPFLVKVTTPDPYTSNEEMKRNARRNTERDKEKQRELQKQKQPKGAKKKGGNQGKHVIRQNLMGMGRADSIASSIYKRQSDGTLHQILGEFALDKSTNCGDVIQVADGTEYQVQKARCQYKYAGGKRFVMIRKILEVKEVARIQLEKEILTSYEKDTGATEDHPPQLE